MADFKKGDRVQVFPNMRSSHVEDHDEPVWVGTVVEVYRIPEILYRSYSVQPDTGRLPRNVLDYRVKPLKEEQ